METKIIQPNWAFRPDQWSEVFLRGLSKILFQWKGKSIWEIGVGTGNNIIQLHDRAEAFKWYISDLNPDCTSLAYENILNSLPFNQGNIIPLHGAWDLVTPPIDSHEEAPRIDVIFGCIPQVSHILNLKDGDNMAHYYDSKKYSSRLNILGLGLNDVLLKTAKNLVKDSVVLNLSGRPGLSKLLDMFDGYGYVPEVIHQEVVLQHCDTSLESLSEFEKIGFHEFEFFSDYQGRNTITATQAEEMRLGHKDVYHMLYVIQGVVK